jgi:hypothetical protein
VGQWVYGGHKYKWKVTSSTSLNCSDGTRREELVRSEWSLRGHAIGEEYFFQRKGTNLARRARERERDRGRERSLLNLDL